MNKDEIVDKVQAVLAEQLAVERTQVKPEARFDEDLDADSLDLVETVMVLEEELGVKIEDEEMAEVDTVGQAIDLVSRKLGITASA